MCCEPLIGAKLSFTLGDPGSSQVAGVPSTCMVLATVLTSSFNVGYPTPMGARIRRRADRQGNMLAGSWLHAVEKAL
jgi:hypothetical protein